MSTSYPSLKAALADHPQCIGLHLDLSPYDIKVKLAFARDGQWEFEQKNIKLQDDDWAYIHSQIHWKILEVHLSLFTKAQLNERLPGINEWLMKLSALKQLQRLMIHSHWVKDVQVSLNGLSQLEEVDMKELSVELTEPLPKVHTFLLNSFSLIDVPQLLSCLNPQVLRRADFRHCDLTEIPNELTQFANLEQLGLTGNKIQTLPVELLQLKKLTSLNLNNNQIAKLPDQVMQLEQLEDLLINQNPLTTATEIKGKTVLIKAIQWCATHQMPFSQRKVLLDLMQENGPELAKASWQELIYALSTGIEVISRKAMMQLSQQLANPFTIGFEDQPSTIALIGKIKGLSVGEITTQLKKKGIGVQNRLSDQATAICLGEALELNQAREVLESKLPIALPQHLKDFLMRLETPYLKESDSEMQENLARLLINGEEGNTKLALQLMHTGGVPDQVFYYVLLLGMRKGTPQWKDFRPLLERYATPLQYDFIKRYRQRYFADVIAAMLEAPVFEQKTLVKVGMRLFYVPFEHRRLIYSYVTYETTNYPAFLEVVKKSFEAGGEAAREVYRTMLDGTALDMLFPNFYKFQFVKKLLEFPQIEKITCTFECIAIPANRTLLTKLPNLKQMIIYKSSTYDVNDEKTKKTLSALRTRLPAVMFTWEDYI